LDLRVVLRLKLFEEIQNTKLFETIWGKVKVNSD